MPCRASGRDAPCALVSHLSLVWAFALGGVLVLQLANNAQLGRTLDSASLSALCSFLVGTLVLALAVLATRPAVPHGAALWAVPPGAWPAGGLLGAAYFSSTVLLAPHLGAAALLALVIAGQVLAAAAVDHYGLFGFEVRPFGATRAGACALMLAGAWLFAR